MNVLQVLTLGPPAGFPAVLADSIREAFPQAVITPVGDFAAALSSPAGPGLELLLLGGASGQDAVAAGEARDPDELPRWGMLTFGKENDLLPLEGWTVRPLAAMLSAAATQHALNRDNARLRGDLLTMGRRISHDLRTPLGGIFATMDVLSESIPSSAGYTQPVFSSLDEITRILNRTSFLLKAIAQPLPPAPLNMGVAVHEALQRLDRMVHDKQARIEQPDSWPMVSGVAPWVELIWWNLLHNAMQNGGTNPHVRTGWEETNHGFRFWVRDNGPGLPDKRTRPVFTAFHLLHDSNAPRGLGLPIVRRLVELQEGNFGYTSGAEGGAEFHFTLPKPL